MMDILRRIRRIALRRAQQEFNRWDETWNPPYSLLGLGVVVGIVGAVLCQIITMVSVIILVWERRDTPEFWLIVVSVAFSYGALPGFALGFVSGLAQALCWTRRVRLAGLACVAGASAVLAWLINTLVEFVRVVPDKSTYILWLLLFCASLLWSGILLINGARLLRIK